jgi:hypothetical protein
MSIASPTWAVAGAVTSNLVTNPVAATETEDIELITIPTRVQRTTRFIMKISKNKFFQYGNTTIV